LVGRDLGQSRQTGVCPHVRRRIHRAFVQPAEWFARSAATSSASTRPSVTLRHTRIVYADWTASGRMYGPLEDVMRDRILPFVGNTHTETSETGATMTWRITTP
jgi:hypothetical protein